MNKIVELFGEISSGVQWSTTHGGWPKLVEAHSFDLPNLGDFEMGTLNISLDNKLWLPPDHIKYVKEARRLASSRAISPESKELLLNGNYIHPNLFVVLINDVDFARNDAYLYFAAAHSWRPHELEPPASLFKRGVIEILSPKYLRFVLKAENTRQPLRVKITLGHDFTANSNLNREA